MSQVTYRTAREAKRAWWAKVLIKSKKDKQETGITIKEWCRQNNVNEKRYWYYHKLFGDALAQSMNEEGNEDFLPMPVQNKTEFSLLDTTNITTDTDNKKIEVYMGNTRIEIPENISDEFLYRIMKAASHV